jgi:hypothetical protein
MLVHNSETLGKKGDLIGIEKSLGEEKRSKEGYWNNSIRGRVELSTA